MKLPLVIACITACVALMPFSVEARVTLPSVIGSHMVLQRGNNAVIWGWTDQPSEQITIHLSNGKVISEGTTLASSITGRWSYNVASKQSIPASTGFTITIRDSNSEIQLENIAFGDVILCSGQSNMAMSVSGVYNSTEEVANSNYPNLRMFTVKQDNANVSRDDVVSSSPHFNWTASGPHAFTNGTDMIEIFWGVFSGVCYFTGRDLLNSLGGEVPIGVIVSAVVGSYIEAWSNEAALAKCPDSDPDPNAFHTRTGFWNGMIHPFLSMRFQSVIWYQGESHAGNHRVDLYRCQFPALINEWRSQFNNLELPFTFVQLAPCPGNCVIFDVVETWAPMQITQTIGLTLPHTGLKLNGTEGCGIEVTEGCCQENPFEILTWPSMTWTRAAAADIVHHTVYIQRGLALNKDTAVLGLRYAYEKFVECALYNSDWLPMGPFIQSVLPGRKVQEMKWPPVY